MIAETDILVIGAGIAGASVAAELAGRRRVIIVERELHVGYHATGRSVALFTETYGGDTVRALTMASRNFFENPPDGFAGTPLLTPRGVLYIARQDQGESLHRLMRHTSTESRVKRISAAEARALIPILREVYSGEALYEMGASDINVHELHSGFLRKACAEGAAVRLNCEVLALDRAANGWLVNTTSGEISASVVINAAGAWADEVGKMASAQRIGLQPMRRTVLLIDSPPEIDLKSCPLTVDIDQQFYIKPEVGRLLLSPADETPSLPCDAQPEEYDIAIAVDRIERAMRLDIRHIHRKWAGLRSVVRDGVPVVGRDPIREGFFWLAGQGGYGIQTAPAMARIAASLLCERPIPSDITDFGIQQISLSPARLR
jgi:D-arginine dehydrogenase